MVKVLRVMGGLDIGGVEMGVLNYLKRVDIERVQTTLYCLQDRRGLLPEIEALQVPVVFRPHAGNPFPTVRKLESYLKEHRPDVVHCHNLFFAGWIMRAAHQAGVPVRITHANNTGDRRQNGLMRPLYHALMRRLIHRHATGRLAVSREAGKYLFGDDPFEVITSGIETREFRPAGQGEEIRQGLGIPPGKKVIGHVGNLRTQKNHAFLLRIAAEIQALDPEVHFVLVGEGTLRGPLENQAQELGLADQISWLGSRKDVPRLMAGLFDAFLFPSLYEGMGQVLVQAQAAGLPVIASDNLPRDTEVVPQLLHWTSLESAAGSWAQRVLEALANPVVDRMAAFEQVRASQFDVDYTVQRLTQIYEGATPS